MEDVIRGEMGLLSEGVEKTLSPSLVLRGWNKGSGKKKGCDILNPGGISSERISRREGLLASRNKGSGHSVLSMGIP
ncbi:hypothetical protein PAXRUDRAFT_821987 [Paxillus rubicundulus Ve08.2h10]|uniref:Uncharacterized protein n=1 Tax=Paxillus rubicundulus Ve08.2h10 TaxID=930991 RepID=A0A0D0EA88_9AGAM|nr:hypothetical protein PAXRUDRAFT_821987 [Paxillus rubicundulus Ve08.2h10]